MWQQWYNVDTKENKTKTKDGDSVMGKQNERPKDLIFKVRVDSVDICMLKKISEMKGISMSASCRMGIAALYQHCLEEMQNNG